MRKLRILFAGSGEFGIPTLRALGQRHHVLRVYTQPDRPAGRGRKLTPTAIAAAAREINLPLTATADLNSEALPPADVLVVIAFGQKISQPVTKHPVLGAVNLHASLLPRYRGAAPIHHALINGESVVGNSVIRLASRMDAGAILGQSRLDVSPAETTGELHDRLAAEGAPLVLGVLENLAAGTAAEQEQDHRLATTAPKLSRADARVDFTLPAAVVAARINGLSPWPGVRVRLLDSAGSACDRLLLLRARSAELRDQAPPPPGVLGLVSPGNVSPAVVGAGGPEAVEILDVQPEGKRPMTLAAYSHGHRWQPGMRLVSD